MTLRVSVLRCEYAVDPCGIDTQRPRLSWRIVSERRGTLQRTYRIQVAATREDLESEKNLKWDTGERSSDRSTQVVYQGPTLGSFEHCWWHVRVSDDLGKHSAWSSPASWEMGILEASQWQATWITPCLDEKRTDNPCPMLRKEFSLSGRVRSARAYVTALGLYALEINGRTVGDLRFTPGFTSFHQRLHYQIFDVTNHLAQGANAIGVTLADGWYRGHLWVRSKPNIFGDKLALLMMLRVQYEDGRQELLSSDESWQCTTGPLRSSDLYFGEVYDARLEIEDWSRPGLAKDRQWGAVKRFEYPTDHLCCSPSPPVRAIEELPAQKIFQTPKGECVVDFGQTLAGVVGIELQGERGTEVTLSYCEELTKHGNFNVEQLDLLGYQKRTGRYYQIDRYILKGGGLERFEPRFTFHGFRYLKVEGYPGPLSQENVTAFVLRSDLAETGSFSCSNPLLNQLQHNILWSQKGNFLEIPTDCPQREKMGWTGDIQIYAPTACFLMDSAGFLTKWLRDLKADQRPNGLIPHIIPWLPEYPVFGPLGVGGSSAWGDACTIVPWTLYVYYDDKRILSEMYDVMKKWLSFIDSRAKNYLWSRGMHWGDWLEPGKKTIHYFMPWAKKGYVATPFWAHSAQLTARVASRLGKDEDARHYERLSQNIKQAYVRKYVHRDGRLQPHRQGAYVLALAFDMVPEDMAPRLAAHLAALVRENDNHLDTGFTSTAHLCHVLCRYGYEDLAFSLLNQDTVPSWLYQVRRGATTVWETWDAIHADGSLEKGMSFNHYAFGAIGDWLYRYVAGIQPDEARPGFKHIRLAPHPGGGLTNARASFQSRYGEVTISWERDGSDMLVDVTVPANTTASLRLPNARSSEVTESGQRLASAEGVTKVREHRGDVLASLGSGTYSFRYVYKARPSPIA